MAFDIEFISYIHGLTKKFTAEHLSDESIFFEGVWELYEFQLKKWLKRPSKKWKFKPPRKKLTRILTISGGVQSLNLDAPKVIDVFVNTLTQISIKGDSSLKMIKDTMRGLMEEFDLPATLRPQALVFFAPILHRDMVEGRAVSRKTYEKKLNLDSDKEPGKDDVCQGDLKRYIMYSNKDTEGTKLTKTEYLENKKKYLINASDYLFIIDEVNYVCFFKGNEITGKMKPVKPAWKAFIYLIMKKDSSNVSYHDIFQFARKKERYYEKETYKVVQKWISLFRKYVDEEDDFRWFFTPMEVIGYEYQLGADFKFCIFRHLKGI